MAYDHQIFLGPHHAYRATALRGADDVGMAIVQVRVEADAEVRQVAADVPAHRRRMLSNAPGEHERVQAAEYSGQCTDRFAELIAKHIHRLGGMPIAVSAFQQESHIWTEPRDSEQPGLMIHQVFQPGGIISFDSEQMDEQPRIGRDPNFPVRFSVESGVKSPYVSTCSTDPPCSRSAGAR